MLLFLRPAGTAWGSAVEYGKKRNYEQGIGRRLLASEENYCRDMPGIYGSWAHERSAIQALGVIGEREWWLRRYHREDLVGRVQQCCRAHQRMRQWVSNRPIMTGLGKISADTCSV